MLTKVTHYTVYHHSRVNQVPRVPLVTRVTRVTRESWDAKETLDWTALLDHLERMDPRGTEDLMDHRDLL